VAWVRAKAFVVTADYNPALQMLDQAELRRAMEPKPQQLMLFETREPAGQSEF